MQSSQKIELIHVKEVDTERYAHRAADRTLVPVAHRQVAKSQSPNLRTTNPVTGV